MSQALPQSQLGGIKTKTLVDGFAKVRVVDEKASRVLGLDPVSTVWGRPTGRPIYDRLPGVSQGYREEFAGELETGLVYIDQQSQSYSGPGSLEVGAWAEDGRVLIVYDGTITWAHGQVPTSTLAINLETIIPGGVQDGSYQVGYYLDKTVPETRSHSIYSVSDYSLSNTSTVYATNREAKGHSLEYMFSEAEDGFWAPSEFGDSGDYSSGSWVVLDFTESVTASSFDVRAASQSLATAKCALYVSEDAIVWNFVDSVSSNGTTWKLANPGDKHRYYKLYFWGGKVGVSEVRYSGDALFPNQRPTGPISSSEIFLEPQFDQIERPHALLGLITVSNFKIVSIADARQFSTKKYEPVASWLTDFQDLTLRKLVTDIGGYAERFLSPIGGGSHFYEDLPLANVALGPETSVQVISFPSRVELDPPSVVMSQTVFTSSVFPSAVFLLKGPTEASDLSPKAYVDTSLAPTLDNGKF